jgi:hypothetical protein
LYKHQRFSSHAYASVDSFEIGEKVEPNICSKQDFHGFPMVFTMVFFYTWPKQIATNLVGETHPVVPQSGHGAHGAPERRAPKIMEAK